ncbi:MAG TPA: ABC transporter permease [Candidatus Limnocylindria bacterium]|nr:ABC transporter permease [Candidatus Limnocylindria bacterium]
MQAAFIALILLSWELSARLGITNANLLSQPTAIIGTVVGMIFGGDVYGQTIYQHLVTTLQELLSGYLIGSALGLIVGLVFARSPLVTRVFQPYILAAYSIPKIALAPLFVMFLGIGIVSKIAIVTVGVFFMLFFNTFAGVVGVNEEYIQAARIMGASRLRIFRQIILPAALPAIITGFKMGVPFAMIGAIVGEFIAAFNSGIGYVIIHATSLFDPATLFAAIFFLVLVVWVLGQIISFVEGRVLRWQPRRREDESVVSA